MKTTFTKVLLAVAVLLTVAVSTFGFGSVRNRPHSYFSVVPELGSFEGFAENIREFRNTNDYNSEWARCELTEIIHGLTQYSDFADSEWFRRELVGYSSARRIALQARSAEYEYEGDLLRLLYITRQSLPSFVTDSGLKARVGKKGGPVKDAAQRVWKGKEIRDLARCLESYPPEKAARLAQVICQTWYRGAPKNYTDVWPSWASESLSDVYFDIRMVELAKKSIVVKILGAEGILGIPSGTYAHFVWSGRESIYIDLDDVGMCHKDIPELRKLVGHPFYGEFALKYLDMLTR